MRTRYMLLLAGSSALALATNAYAQDRSADSANLQEIVVTGSRVISNGNQAPTPITVMSTEKLLETTPSNVGHALIALPQFSASAPERNVNNASQNWNGAYLNLRQFGPQRNLVLLDGVRLPPSAATGAVDTNIVPQALISRVDIVTGGASAVYGSDAVTGVINFVLDHDFNGVKGATQYGISEYGDAATYRASITGGLKVGDRGHFEVTFDRFHQDEVPDYSRPQGNPNFWTIGGTGTAAAPFRLVYNARQPSLGSPGSTIVSAGILKDTIFKQDGVASRFVHGDTNTGVNGLESGGDGSYYDGASTMSLLTTDQAMARFDYEFTDNIQAYAQASLNVAKNEGNFQQVAFLNQTILSGNPYIPASVQTIMTANNLSSFVISRQNTSDQHLPGLRSESQSESGFAQFGLKGAIFNSWRWQTDYLYSRSFLRTINRNNLRSEKVAAALDAVRLANGSIVCQISQTTSAARFPDCQPLNLFGPTAPGLQAMEWVGDDTKFTLVNVMQDISASIIGSPFSTWAGPLSVALSGEYRYQTLSNSSNAEPAEVPNCTGLRANCTAATPLYTSNSTASMYAKQNVKEAAVEAQIPLLKHVPLVQSLDVNLAGRYTGYSTSGTVYTWKFGSVWDVNDQLRIRATRSHDIRAATLTDLYLPQTSTVAGYTDLHTGITALLLSYAAGNPDLKPEKADTTTIGVVYRPSWAPKLSLSLDYYDIVMRDAISQLRGSDTNTQRECENSGGTSPVCDLIIRPLPFSNTTAANYPLRALRYNLNIARQWTHGLDMEANYQLDLADVSTKLPGTLITRLLVTYQPILRTQTLISQPITENAGVATPNSWNVGFSKIRANGTFSYSAEKLSLNWAVRWQSKQQPSDRRLFIDNRPDISSYSYHDLSASYKLNFHGTEVVPFATIQNLFDKQPPIIGTTTSVPGLLFPVPAGYDIMGRYYTVGIRARM